MIFAKIFFCKTKNTEILKFNPNSFLHFILVKVRVRIEGFLEESLGQKRVKDEIGSHLRRKIKDFKKFFFACSHFDWKNRHSLNAHCVEEINRVARSCSTVLNWEREVWFITRVERKIDGTVVGKPRRRQVWKMLGESQSMQQQLAKN